MSEASSAKASTQRGGKPWRLQEASAAGRQGMADSIRGAARFARWGRPGLHSGARFLRFLLRDFELLVRPDPTGLTLQISDRRRPVGGVPEAAVAVDVAAVVRRAAELRLLVEEVCHQGSVRPAQRQAWVQQGQTLHDLLVPPSLRGFLRGAAGASLWIRLRGWAVDLPWEWLHDGEGTWFERYAIGREVPVPPGAAYVPSVAPKAPAQAVVLGDPAGDLPEARAEVDAIHQALRSVGLRPRTQAGSIVADDLRVMLRAADLLHIAAHVDPPGFATEDSLEPGHRAGIRCADGPVRASDLRAMGGTAPFPALVVLNACASHHMAPPLLGSGAGTVVATLTDIGDAAARSVAVALYRGLAEGRPLGEALRRAREAAGELLLAAPYVLFGDPAADLAAAFPVRRAEDAAVPDSPAAWLAATVRVEPEGTDDPEVVAAVAALRDRVARALAEQELAPQSGGPDTLVTRLGLERYGDQYGDAALRMTRALLDAAFTQRVDGWRGSFDLSVGVGLAAGPSRARERAIWMATQASEGVALTGERLRSLARDPHARWARQPGAGGEGPTWRLTFDRKEPKRATEVVGRGPALAQLAESLEDAVESGRPQLAVVGGPAGIGKTALLELYGHRLRERGVGVVHAEVDIFGASRVGGGPEGGSLVQRLVASSLPDRASLPEHSWQWAAALSEVDGTFVWLLDGVERLGEEFEEELATLLDQLERCTLQVVVALRTDREEDKARAERLASRSATGLRQLAPLRPSDARHLLRRSLGVDSLPPELLPLVDQGAGNPLMLLESLGQLRREGGLRRPGRGLLVDPVRLERRGASPLEEAVLAARVDTLGEEERRVVEALAVLGGEVRTEMLEALPGIEAAAVTRAARAGWIRLRSEPVWGGVEARVALRDPLALRVLSGLVPARTARPLHDAALAWHEGQGSPPRLRSWHALRSTDPRQAVLSLWEEAQECSKGHDYDGVLEALEPLERLVATSPERDLPPGTPSPAAIRALRDAVEHALASDDDATRISAIDLATLANTVEPPTDHKIGRYRLLKVLGTGRTGAVYLAEQDGPEGFRRKNALKVLHTTLASSGTFLRAFQREARIAARLIHPNVVGVTDLGQAGDYWFLAMEYVDGCSLSDILDSSPGGLPADIALHLAAGVAAGLAYAHGHVDEGGQLNPVVHRDVGPGNVLVSIEGTPRLYDFGFASAEDTVGPPTETGALRGRAGYAPPERIQGEDVSPASDLWSLGVMLFELITGEPLFEGRTILDVLDAVCTGDLEPVFRRVEALDRELGAWLRKLLERDRSSRFHDAHTLAEALEAMSRRLCPFDESPQRRAAAVVRGVRERAAQ